MFTKKSIGVALTCALALGAFSGSALAIPVTVGGITWDPTNGSDLTVQALNFRESSVAAVGDTLAGYGQIGAINGDLSFCSGCSLNFKFGYTLSAIEGTPANPMIVFTGGSINFWVDPAGTFDVANPATAGIGTPWLTLTGHTAPFTGFTALGDLYSNINGAISAPAAFSGGFGLLDATGGPAAMRMNTNSEPDGADFSLNSEFLSKPFKACTSVSADPTSNCHYPIVGTATLTGKTVSVPEPGMIGMLGLGFGFLGLLLRQRRKEEAEELS